MPAVNVKISPTIISWALSQTKEEKLGSKLMENIQQWLAGTKSPTFNQIEDFSKRSCIPLGYFFLQTPPTETISLLEYRTINSDYVADVSRDLIDIIHEMESVQQWMSDYRDEMGFDAITYVGSLKGMNDKNEIVKKIRKDMGLEERWYEECYNIQEAFNKLRTLLEECGILVMMSGIVGKNTHRSLDLDEFRAFAMINDLAPLIFINGADSWSGRLFSLCHEIVHIWTGENDLYNDRRGLGNGDKPKETLCNAVAGELMVPNRIFLEEWSQIQEIDVYRKIKEAAGRFLCSETVIARKALDNKKIREEVYNKVVEESIENFRKNRQEKNSGGNYYNTVQTRLDKIFIRALCESVNSGRTSYTDAYRLTNTTSKTFSEVVNRMGGILW